MYTKNVSLDTYKGNKLKMITDEFMIHLNPSEITKLYSLENETQVDQYAHSILVNKL